MAQPLALDSAPAGQAAGWRKGQDLIDALPYVDRLTPEEKQQVDKLIQEEVRGLLIVLSSALFVHLHVLPRFPLAALQFSIPAHRRRCGTVHSGRRHT